MKQVRLYSVRVNWSTKGPGDQSIPSASLSVHHITVLNVCAPQLSLPVGPYHPYEPMEPQMDLTHLEMVPALSAVLDKSQTSRPRIFAVFTPVMDEKSSQVHVPGQTVISLWEIREETPQIDESLLELASKKTTAGNLKPEYSLHSLEEVTVDRIVIDVKQVQPGLMFGVSSSDGSVQFRDRSFAVLPSDESSDQGSSLSQAGFILASDPCLHSALSLDHSMTATFGLEHDPKLSLAQLPFEYLDSGSLEKASAVMALNQSAAEAMIGGQHTDLMMTMQSFMAQLPAEQRAILESQNARFAYKALFVADKLNSGIDLRLPPLLACLSTQLLYSNHGERTARSLQWKIAWITLNLRHIALSFGFCLKDTEMSKPGNSVPRFP